MKRLFILALILTFLEVSQGAVVAAITANEFIDLCQNGTLQQIEEAIKAGADVNAKEAGGFTPLMLATYYNKNS
ncbi:MAG: hypothetical protein FWF87_08790 [Synergistaceae bacterium]|nr:hypothetical protein [Synergistaceae bacterium]